MPNWNISGQYMETCNCTMLCPCIITNLAARPTEGDCKAALAMHIERGEKDGTRLDGVNFVIMLYSPGAMAAGNMTVGLVIDEQASDAQVQAIGEIASGAAGGPMAALAPLVGKMAGVERRPVRIDGEGLQWQAQAGELLDQAAEGMPSPVKPGEAIVIDNTLHPVNSRLAVAKANRSHMHAFGMDWDDTTGTRNGHFAPFAWAG